MSGYTSVFFLSAKWKIKKKKKSYFVVDILQLFA